jgi:hypothetical protein
MPKVATACAVAAASFARCTASPVAQQRLGLIRAIVHTAGAVERLADLDDQLQALGGAGRLRGGVLAEDD